MKNKKETPEFIDFAVTARKYKTLLTRKYQNRKVWVDPNPYEIQSFIPGTILQKVQEYIEKFANPSVVS